MPDRIIYNYITTNLINGKQYIGMHCTDDVDDGYLGSGRLIVQAIKKYRKENFKREILVMCQTVEEAHQNEELFIDKYNTLRPNGYNICPTGGIMCVTDRQSAETRKKISDSLKGRVFAPETIAKFHYERSQEARNKQRSSRQGKPSPTKGMKWKNESREKNACPIIQYDVNMSFVKEWGSTGLAAEALGGNINGISNCANGLSKSSMGYIWRYKSTLPRDRKIHGVSQYDIDMNLIRHWDNMSDATQELGISKQSIWTCLNGRFMTAGGFIWKRKEVA